ncbi:MAG: hypothetical protein A3C02_00295 [Candidatus Andersenbacteria bacterium RIFCSPHIGHO2_02_FULL_45_11]|uniref:FAD/NAD(P)-binding domain-containing protein n=1 Tax=Candidatus Andersenbacteria bacterium RIFCSPHIGHO2_12_FULL_45_11 TaxID=1797281 RepID=A0A1G1X307_9BACT|nr:MAG: hypothetical protein A2805_02205 [Candidatus Andersenbacteria bacterium RIFCSPHIGHO2_01_FULL_46_36]OGY33970.1 MAG: hypothetical protein A3D99_04095 [Candidatus Andersenbacteria bacterium RIFCSPHIGHO2_12_FULL_45_11]OGY34537.1 MAG: hypothetical protein A3C02_00295 [Candidatus Andersenbacteria bacterium RIFCSPHIGHO2_02_FULL_45_11]
MKKKVLILGGGFGGIATYRNLHRLIHPTNIHNIRLELISRTNYFTFSPMLHEVATGSVDREHIVQPLREMLHCCGKDFHQAHVTNIDVENKVIQTDTGNHSYDVLVIALGVEQGFFGTPGAAEHALALKWLPGAVAIRNRVISSFEKASEIHDQKDRHHIPKFLNFIIVGGGATGTEFAGQLSDLLHNEMKRFYGDVPMGLANITLIHTGARVLDQLSPSASKIAARRLRSLGVKLLLNKRVTHVTEDGVTLASGTTLLSNSVFWTAGTESTLGSLLNPEYLTPRGLLNVTPTFQLTDHPEVFGIGDCASVNDPLFSYPPLAQAATQASRVVAKNIVAQLHRGSFIQKKYKHKGDIIPLGDGFGIFQGKHILMSGFTAWIFRRIVFLKTMTGWGNRLQVLFDWCIALFLPRDTSEF